MRRTVSQSTVKCINNNIFLFDLNIGIFIEVGVSPKRILNVDISHLPDCTEFFSIDFRQDAMGAYTSATGLWIVQAEES